MISFFFFFNDTATTEIYTLSLHDALPISLEESSVAEPFCVPDAPGESLVVGGNHRPQTGLEANVDTPRGRSADRKSTRLNSSHGYISYAVFCLKKKKKLYRKNDDAYHNPL